MGSVLSLDPVKHQIPSCFEHVFGVPAAGARARCERHDQMTMRWSRLDAKPGEAGVVVNVPTMDVLESELRRLLSAKEGFALATLNLDHVTKLRRSPEFAEAYNAHSHVTADGNPIVWVSRLAGDTVSLLPGSDLVLPVSRIAAASGAQIALLGSSEDALAGAANALSMKVPGLKVVAQIAPPMGFDPKGPLADTYIEDLAASGAGLCFIALGAPKQEIFAAYAMKRLPDMGFMSIGASLDFLSGHQQRAPRLVRKFALEWLWRLAQNPGRMAGRYAACFAILPGLFLHALKTRVSSARVG